MARIGSLVLIAASMVLSNAIKVSEFQNFAPGVYEEWNEANPENVLVADDQLGFVLGGDKFWLITRRPSMRDGRAINTGSATRGGVVSTFLNRNWTTIPYDRLEQDDTFEEKLFALDNELFMLTANVTDAIVFHNLFKWDDINGNWSTIKLDVASNATQALSRGPSHVISHLVPDADANIVFLLATDHELGTTDSETTFLMLEVNVDGATLNQVGPKFRGRVGEAATAMAYKDDQLFVLVSHFNETIRDGKDRNGTVAYVSIDYVVDTETDVITPVNGSTKPDPLPLVAFNFDRTFQLGRSDEYFLLVGRHEDVVDASGVVVDVRRHMINIDLGTMNYHDSIVSLNNTPNSVIAVDGEGLMICTADVKRGVFVASIVLDETEQPAIVPVPLGPSEGHQTPIIPSDPMQGAQTTAVPTMAPLFNQSTVQSDSNASTTLLGIITTSARLPGFNQTTMVPSVQSNLNATTMAAIPQPGGPIDGMGGPP